MLECPECGSFISGRKCACGYFVKGRVLSEYDQIKLDGDRLIEERDHVTSSKAWLDKRGITNSSMTIAEHQKATANYRNKISKTSKPGPRDWAYTILSRHADGENISSYSLKLAREVVAMDSETS